MKIGIDIDGVLTNIEKWQLDKGSSYFTEKYNLSIVDPDGYSLDEIFNISKEKSEEFWHKYLIEYSTKLKARPFAAEVIKKLHQKNEIYIITARVYTTEKSNRGKEMRNIVKNWLKENEIIYDKIIFTPEDKLAICKENNIDIMIEDKKENINKISKEIPVICYHAGYNKNCKGQNIYRAYSWYDILYKVNNLKEGKK